MGKQTKKQQIREQGPVPTPENIAPQPRLYPEVHYIQGSSVEQLEKDVNEWIKGVEGTEVKNLRTVTYKEFLVVEIIYVRYPKPTPSPIARK